MINSAQVLAQNSLGTYLLFSNLLVKIDKHCCGLSPSVLQALGLSQHSMDQQDSVGVESTVSPCFLCRWP